MRSSHHSHKSGPGFGDQIRATLLSGHLGDPRSGGERQNPGRSFDDRRFTSQLVVATGNPRRGLGRLCSGNVDDDIEAGSHLPPSKEFWLGKRERGGGLRIVLIEWPWQSRLRARWATAPPAL